MDADNPDLEEAYTEACNRMEEQEELARLREINWKLVESLRWSLLFAKRFAEKHNDGPTMASCIAQAESILNTATKTNPRRS